MAARRLSGLWLEQRPVIAAPGAATATRQIYSVAAPLEQRDPGLPDSPAMPTRDRPHAATPGEPQAGSALSERKNPLIGGLTAAGWVRLAAWAAPLITTSSVLRPMPAHSASARDSGIAVSRLPWMTSAGDQAVGWRHELPVIRNEDNGQAVSAGVGKTDMLVVELGEGHEETPVRPEPRKTSHGFFRLVEYANCAALEQGRNATMERVV